MEECKFPLLIARVLWENATWVHCGKALPGERDPSWELGQKSKMLPLNETSATQISFFQSKTAQVKEPRQVLTFQVQAGLAPPYSLPSSSFSSFSTQTHTHTSSLTSVTSPSFLPTSPPGESPSCFVPPPEAGGGMSFVAGRGGEGEAEHTRTTHRRGETSGLLVISPHSHSASASCYIPPLFLPSPTTSPPFPKEKEHYTFTFLYKVSLISLTCYKSLQLYACNIVLSLPARSMALSEGGVVAKARVISLVTI